MRNVRGAAVSLGFLAVTPVLIAQVSMSIQINKPQKPVIGMPFSADQSVIIVRHLANGMPLTFEMKGHIYRSAGGIERYDGIMVSSDPTHADPTTLVCILDPAKHTSVLLNTKLKTATIEHFPATATLSIKFLPLQQGRSQGGAIKPSDLVTTDLGKRTQGVMTLVGKRVTGTIAAGKIGNDQILYVTTDAWVYSQLRLQVKEVEQNPLSGERTFELTNIHGDEPDPALFEIPTGYTIRERAPMPDALSQLAAISHQPITQQIQNALNNSDPRTKNSVAYSLAQSNDHLPDAETLAEEAVRLMEQETADVVSRKESDASYTQTVELSSYWDTLGWVYYRQKKQDKAERYVRAAWEVKPNPEYALHLGNIYEAQGRPKEASVLYRMALSVKNSPIWRDEFQTRLAKLGETNGESLPMEVTESLPALDLHLGPKDAEPVVEILVIPTASPVVTYLYGEPAAGKSITQAIQAALSSSLPDNGPETILRRARVSCPAERGPTCELYFLTPDKMNTASAAVHLPQP